MATLQLDPPSTSPNPCPHLVVTSSLSTMSRTILFIAASLLLSQTGCVHRRVTINSNPAGALVRIDGKDIGYTPASMDYTWYGTREVQLLKDGYETQTQLIDISAPWYQRFPLDFVSDNFLGTHVRDHRRYDFQMQPKQPDVSSDVIERGRSLRSEAVHGL
mgnify:FL=1|jgi:hypothetical protein